MQMHARLDLIGRAVASYSVVAGEVAGGKPQGARWMLKRGGARKYCK